jgi:hypothetical protein
MWYGQFPSLPVTCPTARLTVRHLLYVGDYRTMLHEICGLCWWLPNCVALNMWFMLVTPELCCTKYVVPLTHFYAGIFIFIARFYGDFLNTKWLTICSNRPPIPAAEQWVSSHGTGCLFPTQLMCLFQYFCTCDVIIKLVLHFINL